ncbi:endonuclease/exonuclease/phosphatase family protein [Membranihabitans marinus]
MTYNIHHANPPSKPNVIDIDAIAEVIREQNVDLVALQEVDVHTIRSGQDLHQAKALADKLGMEYYFAKAFDYSGGYYGNAVLSKMPILDSLRIPLPTMEGLNAEDRVYAGVKVNYAGHEIYFGSIHLDYKFKENNLAQTKMMLTGLDKIPGNHLIAGDFNVEENSETISLLDQYFTRSCLPNCQPTIPVDNPEKAIDFIFFKPDHLVNSYTNKVIDEKYASDHLPVVAELQLIKK